jgi:hypothetical protein
MAFCIIKYSDNVTSKEDIIWCTLLALMPGAPSLWINRSGREADHLHLSCAAIKSGGAIPSLPHTFS